MNGFDIRFRSGLALLLVALTASSSAHAALNPQWRVRTDSRTGLVRMLSGSHTEPMGKTPEEAARTFLAGNSQVLSRKRVKDELVVTGTFRSPLGHHVRFAHRAAGLPVLNASVTVHLDDRMRVRLVTARPRSATLPTKPDAKVPADTALHAARTAVGITGELRGEQKAELALLPEEGTDRLVYRVSIPARQPMGDWLVVVDATSGKVLSQENLIQKAHGRVFSPNAAVALKDFAIKDGDDAAAAVPSGAYREVELLGLDSSGQLKGPFVDVTGSTGGPALATAGKFDFDRADKRFEQVMVYYHIDRAQRHIQALGFTNANNRPIQVDVHGSQDDNSFYSPMTKALNMGDGGVDDAEDADVICHEYGHSIQDSQVPGFGQTGEGRAMGEGFGDYLASSIREDQSFHPLAIAIWDATSYSQASPPNLRRVDSRKHYPEDIVHQFHADGEIWSASLRQIWEKVGSAICDKLVLQSHFFLEPDAGFADGAEAILQADRHLFQGKYEQDVRAVFEARGILKPEQPAPPQPAPPQPAPPAQPAPPSQPEPPAQP